MKKHRVLAVLAALACCLLLVSVVLAQGSTHFRMLASVFGGGGGSSHSTHYAVSGTLGQPATGLSAGNYNRLGSGFWYTYGSPPQPQVGYRVYLPLIVSNYQ
jgi:hypothetical protein